MTEPDPAAPPPGTTGYRTSTRRRAEERHKALLARHDLGEVDGQFMRTYCLRCGTAIPYVLAPMEAHWRSHHRIAYALASLATRARGAGEVGTTRILAGLAAAVLARRLARIGRRR